jgi:signal transduction histidine kinase/ActR/RegA family two-component response regulator
MPVTHDSPKIDRPLNVAARLVTVLRLQRPDDPFERHGQQAIVLVQAASSFSFLMQAMVVAVSEDLTLPATRGRLIASLLTALIVAASLNVSRAGRLRLSGRVTAGVALLLLAAFGWWAGLRASPQLFVFCTGIIGTLIVLESPRLIKWWVAAFLAVFAFGILVDPVVPNEPSRASLLNGILLSFVFVAMYMKEYRDTLMGGIKSLRSQTARLGESNRELEEALRARDALSEQLANAQRLEAMGRMAGNIAHDFNNQLTVIRGYADLVAKGTTPGTPRQAEIEQLTSAVVRASSITREVLDFASPHGFSMDATDIAALAEALTPDLTQLLAPAVTLRVERPASPVYAMADRSQIERLLMNLAINARDVTPRGRSVVLTVQSAGQHVVCRVIDGGPGVPVALREQIFEPFFTTKGTTGGTGLGLASAFVIARKHGGTLQVGDTPGGGATFTLELPRIAPPERAGVGVRSSTPTATLAAIPHVPPVAGAGPVRVRERAPLASVPPTPIVEIPDDTSTWLAGMSALVVEDDPLLSTLMTRFLHAAGATVHAIDNGDDAVTYLRGALAAGTPLDLVVTDLRMPQGSGAEVIAAAREHTRPLPIVVMSGFFDDAAVAALAARRALVSLAKPFSERELHVALAVARQYADTAARG